MLILCNRSIVSAQRLKQHKTTVSRSMPATRPPSRSSDCVILSLNAVHPLLVMSRAAPRRSPDLGRYIEISPARDRIGRALQRRESSRLRDAQETGVQKWSHGCDNGTGLIWRAEWTAICAKLGPDVVVDDRSRRLQQRV